MNGSSYRRWHRRSIVGAGLAGLSLGGILLSGCTRSLTADLSAPAKKDQSVAKFSGSSQKKTSQKVASKEPSGKARVSDLDNEPPGRMLARKTPPQSDASRTPDSQSGRAEAQIASTNASSVKSQQPPTIRPGSVKPDPKAVAARRRKSTPSQTSASGSSLEVAGGAFSDSSSIKQTGGKQVAANGKKGQNKPQSEARIAPQVNPEPQTEVAAATSNHERRRADKLMDRAHERYSNGYPEEALRLASVAYELEKSRQAVYRPGEERPSDFITWLQSISTIGGNNPPVIRPQQTVAQQATIAPEAGPFIKASGAQWSDRRTRDKQLADANAISGATKPNSGADLAAPQAPRFATADQLNSRAGANAGQEVPVPPQPRNCDVNVAMATGVGPSLISPADSGESQPVANTDRNEEQAALLPAPQVNSGDNTSLPASTTVALTDDSQGETDPFVESETPALMPVGSTQLTIASLVGLVTGVAGMFGLSWWRHQERRHYAAGK
jgi:hypothetical protein